MKISEYPLGIQSFKELRSNDCIYIDKTELIYDLLSGTKFYFLSRPRRFGKSLLVSTLEEFFLGNRELFKGLAIDSLIPGEWERHAVLHFDLSGNSYRKVGDIERSLGWILEKYEQQYGLQKTDEPAPIRFERLINTAYEKSGRGVVVLIDEYDSPIVNSFENTELLEYNRNALHDFYAVMKKSDPMLRFVLLTGVGKLGKLSVFSGLNNIRDITMNSRFSTICGITEAELHKYFEKGIRQLAESHGWTVDEAYARLKKMYDGYHFAKDLTDIYNPYSILNCLADGEMKSYWFASGTPSHLLHVLKESKSDLSKLSGAEATEATLDSADVIQFDPVPFMFYTGYLTVNSFDERRRRYRLRYPNEEVEQGFLQNLLPMITSKVESATGNFVFDCCDMIEEGRIEEFMQAMKAFYAGIPYELSVRNEYYYQNVMYCVGKLLGFYVQAEYRTSHGRIDLVLANTATIYVIEFKLDGSAEEALSQIESKDYALSFAIDGRHVVKVGANFSPVTRTLDKWIIAE